MSSSRDFEWPHFLDLARRLAGASGASEADLRTAISRAYYAAFHVAMELIVGEGFTPSGRGKDHMNVWNNYIRQPPFRDQIGKKGRELLDDRVKADYENPFPGDIEKQTEYALMSARLVVEEVRKMLDAKPRRR